MKTLGAYLVNHIVNILYVLVAQIFATLLYAVDMKALNSSTLSHHDKTDESLKHTLVNILFLGYHQQFIVKVG